MVSLREQFKRRDDLRHGQIEPRVDDADVPALVRLRQVVADELRPQFARSGPELA